MNKKPVAAASDFLFTTPSPLSGVARFFDFAGAFDSYNGSATPAEADAKAIYADWAVVGEDLRSSMSQLEEEEELRGKAA
jgi:hypothetical protein